MGQLHGARGYCVGRTSVPTGAKGNPALSCAEILADNPDATDGAYWIDPDGDGPGEAVEALCDMTTDGGGWPRVFGIEISGNVAKTPNPIADVSSGRAAAATGDGHIGLGSMGAYRAAADLDQLRFECEIPAAGRSGFASRQVGGRERYSYDDRLSSSRHASP